MENEEGQEIFLKQYIQRQETLLLDFIRKSTEIETRLIILNQSFKEMTAKYEESQKQVEIQNEMMQQAANGVESLTVEKKSIEQKNSELLVTIEQLKQNAEQCKNERYALIQELNEAKNKIANFENETKAIIKRADDLAEEYRKQTDELGKLYADYEDLKAKLPINKSKPKKETVILPPDEF